MTKTFFPSLYISSFSTKLSQTFDYHIDNISVIIIILILIILKIILHKCGLGITFFSIRLSHLQNFISFKIPHSIAPRKTRFLHFTAIFRFLCTYIFYLQFTKNPQNMIHYFLLCVWYNFFVCNNTEVYTTRGII